MKKRPKKSYFFRLFRFVVEFFKFYGGCATQPTANNMNTHTFEFSSSRTNFFCQIFIIVLCVSINRNPLYCQSNKHILNFVWFTPGQKHK